MASSEHGRPHAPPRSLRPSRELGGRRGAALISELLSLAVRLAERAGALLLEGQAASAEGEVATKTSTTDMVSEMDRAAEELIVSGIRADRPSDAIVGEEGGGQKGTSGVRWVIDPLDGTTNYLYGHPCFAVSIAAELDGRTVVGVVGDPARGEVFSATAGGGATCNGRPLSVSGASDLSRALVATGFSYLPERRAAQAEMLTAVLPRVRDIRRNGAAALDLCWVACGRLDGYYEAGLQPWDVAAGLLIAAEAGAVTSGIGGGSPSAESVVAVTPDLAHDLLDLLAAAVARSGAMPA